ncbi:Protein phosphatase 2C family protein [Rhynchospora pubera]|uniref:protein-serine/threonine phosphatase n=1 Tax=Rhynchospora pubera TaxID=906938 RepID=A0AAV8G1B7_9POAL|nr:Protein phosphatase 2C family protein [Rhynchospora pubera]
MVYDGEEVKDQGADATGNQANPSASSSKSDLDKKLGVRHPLKHKRFRAGGKKMADPTSSGVGEEELGTTLAAGATPETEEVVVPAGADVALLERSDTEDDDVGYKSGGWRSEDERLSCGYASFRGKRASMEDFYDAKSSKMEGKVINLFGIFDGHGGSRAAEYLKEHLFNNLMKHPQFLIDTKLAISETYKKTDSDFLETETSTLRDDGSTASTAVLVENHLYVANVGDSRAIISKAGKAIPLSDDHKPNRRDERERIENAGGVVMWAGTWRVGGVLAMSRAFGNRLLKQFVVAEPEIQEEEITDELEFLILASDGLWDVVPNEDAVLLVRGEDEPEAAARKLTETAYMRGSADNITCIVVKFHHEKLTEVDDSPPHPSPSDDQS